MCYWPGYEKKTDDSLNHGRPPPPPPVGPLPGSPGATSLIKEPILVWFSLGDEGVVIRFEIAMTVRLYSMRCCGWLSLKAEGGGGGGPSPRPVPCPVSCLLLDTLQSPISLLNVSPHFPSHISPYHRLLSISLSFTVSFFPTVPLPRITTRKPVVVAVPIVKVSVSLVDADVVGDATC